MDICAWWGILHFVLTLLLRLHWQSMIELSRTQDEEVGDGTTSVIVLGMFNAFGYVTLLKW